jgi:hypothetical protein
MLTPPDPGQPDQEHDQHESKPSHIDEHTDPRDTFSGQAGMNRKHTEDAAAVKR